MKKVRFLFVVLIGLCISLFSCKKDNNEKLTYIASGHPEWAPIMYKDGDKIAGAGAEIVARIMQELNLDVSLQYKGQWEEVLEKVKTGEVDLLVGAYRTSEREKYMLYLRQYCDDPVSLFVKKGNTFAFATWDELIGKTGVVLAGDSYGQDFDKFLNEKLKVVKASTATEAYDLLIRGYVDYFVYAYYAGNRFIKQNNLEDKVEIISKPVSVEKFYITISKKSGLASYASKINEILARWEQDGTTVAIINKYLFIK